MASAAVTMVTGEQLSLVSFYSLRTKEGQHLPSFSRSPQSPPLQETLPKGSSRFQGLWNLATSLC